MISVIDFKKECLEKTPEIIVQEYLIDGACYFFEEIKVGDEFSFKKNLAESLDVHIRDIVIVGSGKLGFSMKPDRNNPSLYLFKEFDYHFKNDSNREKSDLDVGIVSSHLFDKQLVNLYNYTNNYSSLFSDRNALAKLVLKGRLCPRFTPLNYKTTDEVVAFQRRKKMDYGRDINIEIYKSWFFFEKYHQNNVNRIKLNLTAIS